MKQKRVILFIVLILLLLINCSIYFNFENFKEKNIDIVIANTSYNEKIPIYIEPDENSLIIDTFCGQTCLTRNLYNEKSLIINDFVQVEISKNQIGYVKIENCLFDTIFLDEIKNKKRQQVCKASLKYLGTSYNNMNCVDLIRRSFSIIGIYYKNAVVMDYNTNQIGKQIPEKKLQPGDFIFYRNIANNVSDGHIGLYLGQGYVIQSTIDAGTEYPLGGVRITKLTFRTSPTDFRAPFSLID